MQVGLFCTSNRPHMWNRLYNTLSDTNVDFNLCIAGPNPPIEPLPGNVKYIQTNVKPAQCFFIASHNVVGDYIAPVNDDLIFSPGCIDDMVKLLDRKETTIVSPFFFVKNQKRANHYHFVDTRGWPASDPRSKSKKRSVRGKIVTLDIPMPLINFMHRETFEKIGIDKQYVAMWWNLDMFFELVSIGGKIIISETSYCYDLMGGPNSKSLCHIDCDSFYLCDMWIDGERRRDKRKQVIDPLVYSDDVLTVSQGRKYPPLSDEGAYNVTVKSGKTLNIVPEWV